MGSYCQVRGDAVLQVFVAFPYDPEPLEGYRALYREIEQTNSLVRFVFADERIASDTARARKQLEGEIVGLISDATEAIIGEKVDASKDKQLIDKALKGQTA